MHKSRLLEIFSALGKAEQRELGKFVRSPVYNLRQDVADLYDYLFKAAALDDTSALSREQVFRGIFPNEPFDGAKMDYTLSFLFSVVKDYLVFKEQAVDPFGNALLLARALRRRNLGRQFEREVKNLEKLAAQQVFRGAEHHFNQFRLHLEKHTYAKQKSRTSTESFQEFSEELTHYFYARKLWEACTVVTHNAVEQLEFQDSDLLRFILQQVEQKDFSATPAVNLYFHCYKALTETDSLRWFEALRGLMRLHHESLPPTEVKELYLVAVNYCIRRFNNGERSFLEEALQLYREGLELRAFLENNLLSRFTYNNIVMAGLLLKDFDWVERFLHEYRDYIEPAFRERTFNYNLAIFYFQKPDYKRAMELLQQADFDDIMHNLNARRMLLKIYYETSEWEALNSQIVSFKSFIYRHRELGAHHRELYLNFLRFTRRLLALDRYDKEAVAQFRQELASSENVAEKNWLLHQLQ